jgi:hypothetical protein
MATTFSHPSHGACQASGSQSGFSVGPRDRVAQFRGLLVALLYLEKYDELLHKNSTSQNPQLVLEHVGWIAIRDLRAKIRDVWSKLETHMAIYKGPEMSKLYVDCGGNAEGLYMFGLHVEQKAQEGEIPNDLSSVFARMALSNSMFSHLTEQHPQTDNLVITDSLLWGEGLPTLERRILENLSKAIWPNLDQPPYLPTNSQGPLAPYQYNTDYVQSQPYLLPIDNSLTAHTHSLGQLGSTANSGPDTCSSIPTANRTPYGLDTQSTQHQALESSEERIQYGLLGSQFPSYSLQEMPNPNSTDLAFPRSFPSGLGTVSGSQYPFESTMSQAQSDWTTTNAYIPSVPDSNGGLRKARLLQNIFHYLDHLGDLPYDLSVGVMIVTDSWEMELRLMRIDREIKDFILPLSSSRKEHGWNLHCQAIVAVAETFLKRQCFRNIEEAADFMIFRLGRVSCMHLDEWSSIMTYKYRRLCSPTIHYGTEHSTPRCAQPKRRRAFQPSNKKGRKSLQRKIIS